MIGMTLKKFKDLHDRGYPTTASIELTTRCNLACDYCFVTPSSSELTTIQLCETLDRLADSGIMSLLLTGGEPFLRSDILAILEHVVQRRFFDTVILSNGTVLTSDHIVFLREHAKYFGYIRFTFFSHHAAAHDAFTGTAGSFDRTLAAADALHAAGVRTMVIVNLIQSRHHRCNEIVFRRPRFFGAYRINENQRERLHPLHLCPDNDQTFLQNLFVPYRQ
jgi:MoaA/NifB/PqqE/SkfB family radical SAM enzyme